VIMDRKRTVSPGHAGPLAGVRVLDMSRLLPGPFASLILRDLGAEVIKVEDSEGGDYVRYNPPVIDDGNSVVFHALNRGKKSVVFNLKKKEHVQQFKQLVATADVVLESFRPGVLARLGLGPEQLLSEFPWLVLCSISGYGQTGPDTLKAGHDINYLAQAGVLGMMKTPSVLPVQVADVCSGALPAVVQILAALRRTEREGKGAIIDVSMTDNSYTLLLMPQAKFSATGELIGAGRDTLSGGLPCYDVYKTKDGFYSVGALEPKFWKPLVESLGLPELASPAFQFAQGEEGDQVRAQVQAKFASKTNGEWVRHFEKVDACVEPILRPEEVSKRQPQLAARELDIEVRVGERMVSLPKTPLRMTGVKHVAEPGPLIGQHTEEILEELRAGVRSKL